MVVRTCFRIVTNQVLERPLVTLLKTFAIWGPMINKTANTTSATNTRINAYSTKPCPRSLDKYIFHLPYIECTGELDLSQ